MKQEKNNLGTSFQERLYKKYKNNLGVIMRILILTVIFLTSLFAQGQMDRADRDEMNLRKERMEQLKNQHQSTMIGIQTDYLNLSVEQAEQFLKATEVNAMAITKLDGTAKGGVLIGISDQFKIPVKYIGVGEKVDQLQVFNRNAFIDSLFSGSSFKS